MLSAGKLRHRITIEEPVEVQDATTGEVTRTWAVVHANVPAAIEPVSVREFIASRQVQVELVANIVIRFLPGLRPNMRIRAGETVYNPAGFLSDKASGREYLTVPCTAGVNEG